MASIFMKEKIGQMPAKVTEVPAPETSSLQKSARKRRQPMTKQLTFSIGKQYDRWKRLREELGLMRGRVDDVSLAAILLDMYETKREGTLSATTHCVQCHAPLTLVCFRCQWPRPKTSHSHDAVQNTPVPTMVISDDERQAIQTWHQCGDFVQGSSINMTESETNLSHLADSSVIQVKQENHSDSNVMTDNNQADLPLSDPSSSLSLHVEKRTYSSSAECVAGSALAEPAAHSALEDTVMADGDNLQGFRYVTYSSVTHQETDVKSAGSQSALLTRDPQTDHAFTNLYQTYYTPSVGKTLKKSAHLSALEAAESVVRLENKLPASHGQATEVRFCHEKGACKKSDWTSAVDTDTVQCASEQMLAVDTDGPHTKSVHAVRAENSNSAVPVGRVKKRGRPPKQVTHIAETDETLNISSKVSKKAKDATLGASVISRKKKGRPKRNETNVIQTNIKHSPLLLSAASTVNTNSTKGYMHKGVNSPSADSVVAKCENSGVCVDSGSNPLVPAAASTVYSTDSCMQEGSQRELLIDGPLPPSSVKKRKGRLSTGSRSPFLCSECGAKFQRANSLKLHLRTRHSSDKPYMCKECGSSFASSTLLKGHIRTHSSDRPFVCEKCGATYKHKANLYTHNLSRHSATKKFVCQQCNTAFARKGILKTHMRIHTGEKPFTCKYCGISFAQLNALKAHEMIHTDQRPFTCSECGASFRQQVNLICHIRCHTGERPFACKLCNATFKQPGYMKIHMRSHTGEKPYMCDQCPFRCTTSSALINHKRGHTGEKPYACTNCDSAFRTSTQLARHMPKHTGERNFVCSACGYAFTRSAHLKTHFKRKHSHLIEKS